MPGPVMVSKPSSFAKTTEVENASKAMTKKRNKTLRLILFMSKLLLQNVSAAHLGVFKTLYTGDKNQVPDFASLAKGEILWLRLKPCVRKAFLRNNLVNYTTVPTGANSWSLGEQVQLSLRVLTDAEQLSDFRLAA